MTTNNMRYCPYGSCRARLNRDGSVTLISYATEILTIAGNWVNIHYNPTCSATTRKHVGCFLKQYAPTVTYQIVKDNWVNGAVGFTF